MNEHFKIIIICFTYSKHLGGRITPTYRTNKRIYLIFFLLRNHDHFQANSIIEINLDVGP